MFWARESLSLSYTYMSEPRLLMNMDIKFNVPVESDSDVLASCHF